jgi:hypothetical protein
MKSRGAKTRILLVALALSASSVSACKARPGSALPAPWEPIDPDFVGCEGG